MHHIAIMRRSWHLTEKVLSGEKTIESRWYVTKRAPWDKIASGDVVFFKDSGFPVTVKVEVVKAEQIALTPAKVLAILKKDYREIGISKERIVELYERYKEKKYCILINLRNPAAVKPFEINKRGFGNANAWLCVADVKNIMR
jgi:ASC-1-like (ASCH) protein